MGSADVPRHGLKPFMRFSSSNYRIVFRNVTVIDPRGGLTRVGWVVSRRSQADREPMGLLPLLPVSVVQARCFDTPPRILLSCTCPATVDNNPDEIAFDPANGDAYVTCLNASSVSVISGSNNTLVRTVGVGSTPSGIVFDTADGCFYVVNHGSNTVSVLASSSSPQVPEFPGPVVLIVLVASAGVTLLLDRGFRANRTMPPDLPSTSAIREDEASAC